MTNSEKKIQVPTEEKFEQGNKQILLEIIIADDEI